MWPNGLFDTSTSSTQERPSIIAILIGLFTGTKP